MLRGWMQPGGRGPGAGGAYAAPAAPAPRAAAASRAAPLPRPQAGWGGAAVPETRQKNRRKMVFFAPLREKCAPRGRESRCLRAGGAGPPRGHPKKRLRGAGACGGLGAPCPGTALGRHQLAAVPSVPGSPGSLAREKSHKAAQRSGVCRLLSDILWHRDILPSSGLYQGPHSAGASHTLSPEGGGSSRVRARTEITVGVPGLKQFAVFVSLLCFRKVTGSRLQWGFVFYKCAASSTVHYRTGSTQI